MTLFIVLIVTAFNTFARADIYHCTTEFGEAVPLRKVILKPSQPCPKCEDPSVLPSKVAVETSREWNQDVALDTKQPSEKKRKVYSINNRTALFDWRYMKTPGTSFRLSVDCPQDQQESNSKCRGSFLDQPKPTEMKIEASLTDRRRSKNRGWAELALSDREHLDFRVRLFKEAVGEDTSPAVPVSASGEKIILHTEFEFIMDVGVDEQLLILKSVRHRLAALEIKIRCKTEGVR